MLQQVKLTTVKAIKSIMPFSIAAMVLWVMLFTLWLWSVSPFDWSIADSLSFFPITAFVYTVTNILGIAMISTIYSSSKIKLNRLFNSILGLIIGILMIGISSSIVWLSFYSNSNYNSVQIGEMVFNPLLSIPNLVTVAVLVYAGWKINILAIPEIQR